MLALFRGPAGWGAIARSNYSGLRYREPIHRTIRDLAISYVEGYFNLRRQKTLRRYSRPIGMRRFDYLDWMVARGASPEEAKDHLDALVRGVHFTIE